MYARSLRAARFPACCLFVRRAPIPPRGVACCGCREWPRPRSAPARSGPRCGRRDRSGVPRHAGAAVRAARRALGCSVTLKVETLNPVRSFKGRGTETVAAVAARRGRVARGVRERRQSRAGAGLQRRAPRPGGHRRGREDRQPAQAAPDRRLRRRRAARRRGHRRRPPAGAGDRRGRRRLPGRGQLGPRDLRGRRHDRPRARPRRSGARRRARRRSAAERWPAAWATSCARSPTTWR